MKQRTKSNIYFGKQLQNIIIQYNQETDPLIRQKLYKNHIDFAFKKIISSLLYKYDIQKRIQNSQTLFSECLSNMIQKMDGFDPSRGSGFTYFTVVARNFILQQLDKGIRHNEKFKSINQINEYGEEINLLETCSYDNWIHEQNKKYSKTLMSLVFKQLIQEIKNDIIPTKLKNKNEIQIANAVIQLMKDINIIKNFNKKAVIIYIMEMTGQNSDLINKVLKIIGKSYYKIKNNIIENSLELLQFQIW